MRSVIQQQMQAILSSGLGSGRDALLKLRGRYKASLKIRADLDKAVGKRPAKCDPAHAIPLSTHAQCPHDTVSNALSRSDTGSWLLLRVNLPAKSFTSDQLATDMNRECYSDSDAKKDVQDHMPTARVKKASIVRNPIYGSTIYNQDAPQPQSPTRVYNPLIDILQRKQSRSSWLGFELESGLRTPARSSSAIQASVRSYTCELMRADSMHMHSEEFDLQSHPLAGDEQEPMGSNPGEEGDSPICVGPNVHLSVPTPASSHARSSGQPEGDNEGVYRSMSWSSLLVSRRTKPAYGRSTTPDGASGSAPEEAAKAGLHSRHLSSTSLCSQASNGLGFDLEALRVDSMRGNSFAAGDSVARLQDGARPARRARARSGLQVVFDSASAPRGFVSQAYRQVTERRV